MTAAPDLPPGAPQPGTIFAEKYRVERVLGIGGMGYVLAATHLHLQERVAIKLLLPERASQPETVARFLREGRAAVKIRSEHVARVLDVGEADGAPFIVMEYLDGSDLAGILRERKQLPVPTAVDYLLQACEAIAEAHAMQTVHRDLKPANLFLVRRRGGGDCVKVLDFGISKTVASGDDDVAMTKTTSTVGTPLYMSPEQLRSAKNVDARSDIWSIGVILFELIAGRPPFRASTIAELGALVLTSNAPDLRKVVPDAPPTLAAVIATCLQRDPGQRFASLSELASALAPFATADGRASADRIVSVLADVPRPESTPRIVGDAGVATADLGASTYGDAATGGGTTAGAWAKGASIAPAKPAPLRGIGRFVAAIGLLVAVGVAGGLWLAKREARRAAAAAQSTSAIANAPPAPAAALPEAGASAAAPAAVETAIVAPVTPAATTAAPAVATAPARGTKKLPRSKATEPPPAPSPAPAPVTTASSKKSEFSPSRYGD